MLDPNSFAFSNFANQPPGYYTPTPGGTNTIYHPQAGDLHTPGFSIGLGTPLSMPTSDAGIPINQTSGGNVVDFHPQALAPHVFQNTHPFGYQGIQQPQHAQQTFAPHQFTQQQPIFEPFHQQHTVDAKIPDFSVDVEMQEQQPLDPFAQPSIDLPIGKPVPPPAEK
jgi:hypothetical protein